MHRGKREILESVGRGELSVEEGVAEILALGESEAAEEPAAAGQEAGGAAFAHVDFEACWEPTAPPPAPVGRGAGRRTLLIGARADALDALARGLEGHDVIVVRWAGFGAEGAARRPGDPSVHQADRSRRDSAARYDVDPSREEDVAELARALLSEGGAPDHIVHRWGPEPEAISAGATPELAAALDREVCGMFLLLRGLLARPLRRELAILSLHAGGGEAPPCAAALSGLLGIAAEEEPKLRAKVVLLEEGLPPEVEADLARDELASWTPGEREVRREGDQRWIRRLRRLDADRAPPSPELIPEGGAYLITGGAGGVGLVLAEHLVASRGARVALIGRAPLTEDRARAVARLDGGRGAAIYVQADVCDLESVERAVSIARARFGRIDGVLHAAGIIEDAFLANKSLASFRRVLAPKALGTLHLDHATRSDPLRFFALFSSTATILGRAGQADYAAANHFMDWFAVERNRRARAGGRSGHTVSVNWPLWRDGRMKVSAADEEALFRLGGMVALSASAGCATFERAIGAGVDQILVLYGDRAKIEEVVAARVRPKAAPRGEAAPAAPLDPAALAQRAEGWLLDVIARETKLARHRIDVTRGLDTIGIDSLLIQRLNVIFEDAFGALSKTLLFEYQTIRDLARYFAEGHPGALASVVGLGQEDPAPPAAAPQPVEAPAAAPQPVEAPAPDPRPAATPESPDDIAVIGVSGRYPGAPDLTAFWDNLAHGRSSITRIPADRWDYADYPGVDRDVAAGRLAQWGGFLEEIDAFDPLFFNIAPREAELMDPQERLFLEAAWSALEDAGYSREELHLASRDGDEHAVGVFAGVTFGQYQLIGAEEWGKGNYITPSSSFWSIANRVSYVMNLHGPSMPVDTACSASLTAVHLACESLRREDCRVAIAGGVNLNVHASKYVALHRLKFLSSTGECRAFGEGGDGYVPGEGVGAVVLKRLRDAEADGDFIYAVIKGSAINHGGKTNGYTVPNPNAHTGVIARALRRAGIDPRAISYVEAHGTGTALGDPIEITGLTRAFGPYAVERQTCAIGSVKSNIGHLEAAAGIAALTKVILQLRHRALAPSLHAEVLNPNIDFASTPFFIQRELAPWRRPVIALGGEPREAPRMAAVSSFGAGGSNAHMIVAEYLGPEEPAAVEPAPGPELIVLSAKTDERLRAYAGRLRTGLERLLGGAARPPALRDIAYTLQVGREPLESRLAVIVGSTEELVARLRELAGGRGGDTILTGRVTQERPAPEGADLRALLRQRRWGELARLWIDGVAVPFREAYRGERRRRIQLPTYPFERKRFWVSTSRGVRPAAAEVPEGGTHPLLDRTVPGERGPVFVSSLRRESPLLRDHRIHGRLVLPGVAHLELARAAAEAEEGAPVRALQEVIWLSPVVLEGDAGEVQLTLERRGGHLLFELRSGEEVRSRGRLLFVAPGGAPEPPVDLEDLRRRCTRPLDGKDLYASYRSAGITYGPFFQAVEALRSGGREALGEVRLAPEYAQEVDRYVLHPAVTDGALHTVRALAADLGGGEAMVPFMVGEVAIRGRLPARCLAHARLVDARPEQGMARFDVAILDEGGRALVTFKDLCVRRLKVEPGRAAAAIPAAASGHGTLYRTRFRERPLPARGGALPPEDPALVITHDHDFGLGERLAALHGAHRSPVIRLDGDAGVRDRGRERVALRRPEDYARLLEAAPDAATIYFLGGLDARGYDLDDLDALERAEARGILPLFRLAKGIASLPGRRVRLRVLTSDVQAVGDEPGPANPFAAAIVGFTKVFSRELRSVPVSCVDLAGEELRRGGPALERDLLRALSQEQGGTPGEEVALRGGRRFVRVLELISLLDASPAALPVVPRGAYLIAGGAGGLGLAMGEHLARGHGARLVLVGRSPLTAEKAERLRAIEALGGEALYLQADLCDPARMAAVVAEARERFGPLRGAIHSAIVLKDSTIARLEEPTLREVLAPKARGAVVLHRALASEPLDFFAFFSSAISFSAAPGQANYAAASTCEDAIALAIRARSGRRVKIFNWGFWGDTGVVATDDYRERLAKRGVEAISREEGIAAFDRVMTSRADRVFPLELRPELLERLGVDVTRAQVLRPGAAPSVANAVRAEIARHLADLPEVPGGESLDALERVGRTLLRRAFQAMGVLREAGERHDRAGLAARLRVAPGNERLFDALLDILRKGGTVRIDGDRIEVAAAAGDPDEPSQEREALLARSPDARAFLELVEACTAALPDVLTGARSAVDVLFSGGSRARVEAIYKGNRRSDHFNALVQRGVAAYVARRLEIPGARLALLEIGAGTGGTSAGVLEALRPYGDRITYDYTDISPAFAAHGQRNFGTRYPFAAFRTLDVEQDVVAQGFEAGAYDLVLATNVLHATRDIRETLRRSKALLRENGLIFVNEVTGVRDFATLTFGLTPGWWLFEDDLRLPHAPLLDLAGWRSALEDAGFRKVTAFGLPRGALEEAGQHVILGEGDGWAEERLAPAAGAAPAPAEAAPPEPPPRERAAPAGDLRDQAILYLKDVFGRVLKMDPADLEIDVTFERYGVDSLVSMDILAALEQDLPPLPKTLLFEHLTIEKLAEHLQGRHGEILRSKLGAAGAPAREPARAPAAPAAPALEADRAAPWGGAFASRPARGGDIAIIGVSGRYPMADDIEALWQNLRAGRTAFSEIPPDRWDRREYYDPTGTRPGTSYHPWGAFLSDIDQFDPLFFGISPREAQRTDPQERLFLETVWTTLEDAGCTRAQLSRYADQDGGGGVGVFVGVMYGPYQLLAAEAWGRGHRVDAASAYWSIANRVSYFMNFRGPSMAIDTACSSSLTAIHMACESIRRGDCRAAIAGGVNLIIHPSHHVALAKMNMLSRKPRCHAFGEEGDGFVPGEGVGAVLLKPLADAIRDGDRIHGVIKGSFVNANGKTGGYTVPNPGAQADLIEAALRRAGIDPRTISYVEAQAVGSALADPIEVVGLTHAFERFTSDRGFCAVGSIKPNIGHLEAASGMAQLTKVLLQLRHKEIAPSLHADPPNPAIDFAASPFLVQRRLGPWDRPHVVDPATGERAPRRAGISSFGAGGANAHLIVEEYEGDGRGAEEEDHAPQVVVLSAFRPQHLGAQAQRLLGSLGDAARGAAGVPPRISLPDLAYTLQTGREAMAARLAMIAADVPSLMDQLSAFVAGHEGVPGLFVGVVKKTGRADAPAASDVQRALSEGRLDALAGAWVRGAEIPWVELHAGRTRRKVSLPAYAFARERYWLDGAALDARADGAALVPEVTSDPIPAEDAGAEDAPGAAPSEEAAAGGALVRPDRNIRSSMTARALLEAAQETLIKSMVEILSIKEQDIDLDDHMSDYGFDSISLTRFATLLNGAYGLDLRPTLFFEHSSIRGLAELLVREHGDAIARTLPGEAPRAPDARPPAAPAAAPAKVEPARAAEAPATATARRTAPVDEPIAIIGMHGRFPGSPDLDAFWDNLVAGRHLVTEIPEERFSWRLIYGDPQKDPSKISCRWGSFLDDVDKFDAAFFNISPREARAMDPQHRLFLETVWKTIEDAGYRASDLSDTATGVFVGVASTEYGQLLAASGLEIDGQAATGNTHNMVANRASFLLNLHGPSEPIDTACSSSLAAVHRAVHAIRAGECDMAIAGGVNVILSPAAYLAFGKSGMLASDGRCKTFDSRANGYVRGEGVAAIFLKPLSKARADGDPIYALILGTALNHGGRANSLTAPNPNAQAALIRRAITDAGVAPETIGYLEAHGTGTALGDPIEVNGLKKAFRELQAGRGGGGGERKHCGLGTVKTNVGHLETAAGIAGLVKVVLAMQHRRLPPLLHFERLNENIDLSDSPFYIVDQARDWEPIWDAQRGANVRRAGVSSFGFGGVNVHLVLEGADPPPAPEGAPDAEPTEIIVLSARTEDRLRAYAEALIAYLTAWERPRAGGAAGVSLRALGGASLRDLAYTLQVGREPMTHRLALLASSHEELLEKLKAFAAGRTAADVFVGDDRAHREIVACFEEGDADPYFAELARKGDLRKLAALWAKGFAVDWGALPRAAGCRRIPAPTYPLARERYWLPEPTPLPPPQPTRVEAAPPRVPYADPAPTAAAPPSPPRAPLQPAPPPAPVAVAPAPVAVAPAPVAVAPAPVAVAPAPVASAPAPSVAQEAAPRAAAGAPAGSAEGARRQLRALFAEFIGIDAGAIKPDQDFSSYGIDSISGLRIMQRVQRIFGDDVPMLALIEHSTLDRFMDYIVRNHLKDAPVAAPPEAPPPAPPTPPEAPPPAPPAPPEAPRAAAPPAAPWWALPATPAPAAGKSAGPRLAPFRSAGSRAPLFGLFGDSGEVGWLIPLTRHLDQDQPIYGVEAPGWPRAAASVDEMADACTDTILSARPAGPYGLIGHGTGGAVAFEVARRLLERGRDVTQLLLLDPHEPGAPTLDRLAEHVADPAFVLTWLANTLGAMWSARRVITYGDLPPGDLDAQVERVAALLLANAAVPMPGPKLAPWIRSSAAHWAGAILAVRGHDPRPLPRPVPAALIRPRDRDLGPGNPYGLPALPPDVAAPASAWRRLLGPSARLLEVPGDRLGVVSSDALRAVKDHAFAEPPPLAGPPERAPRASVVMPGGPARAPVRPRATGENGDPRTFLVSINKNGTRRASFWIHTLLGDVSYGLNISRHLGISYPVLGLEQFDVDGNIHLLPTIEEMASQYIRAVRAVQPRGPYIFGGYSFGGVVAHEMAYQLTRAGEEVSDLVLIDSLMPGTPVFYSIDTSAIKVEDFSIMALVLVGNSLCTRWGADRLIQLEELACGDREAQIDFVARHLHERAKVDKTYEQIRRLVKNNYETIVCNNDALNAYVPKPIEAPVSVVLFHATLGFVGPNNPNGIPVVPLRVHDRTNGFGTYYPRPLRIFDLPADHYTICNEEFIKTVVEGTRSSIAALARTT